MNREFFSELEKRFLVTEILRTSSVPLEKILLLYFESNEDPQWENIYIPSGRTLRECKAAFETLRPAPYSTFAMAQSPAQYQTPYAALPDSSTSYRTTVQKRKAGATNEELSSSITLQPRRRLSGIRGQEIGINQPILPKPMSVEPDMAVSDTLRRRRGRPPKSEIEQRRKTITEEEAQSQQIVATQVRQVLPENKRGAVTSYTSSVNVPANLSPKLDPIRRPHSGRFSLDQFIHLPLDRSSSSKISKAKADPPTGSDSTTTEVPTVISSNTSHTASDLQTTDTKNMERLVEILSEPNTT